MSNPFENVPLAPIVLRFRFIEGHGKTYKFKTLAGARKRAQYHLGKHPTGGSDYAVDDYGCCTLRCYGCTLEQLFPED